eukprot:jgi/Galph1/3389/GphlegSOOS_G2059.1
MSESFTLVSMRRLYSSLTSVLNVQYGFRRNLFTSVYNRYAYRSLFEERKEPVGKMPEDGIENIWQNLPPGQYEDYLNTSISFENDKYPEKLDLASDLILDEAGRPVVLESVRKAAEKLLKDPLKLKSPSLFGNEDFLKYGLKLAYGSDLCENEQVNRCSTNFWRNWSFRLAFEFISKNYISIDSRKPRVYIPNFTWPNHVNVVKACGLKLRDYRSYKRSIRGIDMNSCLSDLFRATKGSVALLEASSHNPTGVDFSLEQWGELSKIIKDRKYLCVFNLSYQGLASGDLETDATAIRQFVEDGHRVIVCQDLSKSFCLDENPVGILSVVTSNEQEKNAVLSHLRSLSHCMSSRLPNFGTNIVKIILSEPELKDLWSREVKEVAERLQHTRQQIYDKLVSLDASTDWSFLLKQRGLFLFTELKQHQVERLREDHHIYIQNDGRLNLGAVRAENIDTIVGAIYKASKVEQVASSEDSVQIE